LRGLRAAALIVGLALGGNAEAQSPRLFSAVGDFPLGASANRTDYESIDAAARRLYIAKMGAGQLVVFDLESNRVVAQLDGFPKITGVLAVPELHKVYASVPGAGLLPSLSVGLGMVGLSSGHGAVAVRDTRTLKEIARLPGGVFPDGIAYDPKDQRVFVSDELGSAVTVIDAGADKFVRRIGTGGEVGNVRYDPLLGRVYAPVQSRNELAAIDPAKETIVAKYPLGCDHPHGFIIAPKVSVGYAACDGNDRLVTVDLASGRVLETQAIAHDPDVLAIDADLNRLYVATESGTLSVFDIAAARAPVSLGDAFIAEGAHAVAIDPMTHRLYFALANVHGHAMLKVLAPAH
jgi:DNA-binding beta-propeller fold protein YncE